MKQDKFNTYLGGFFIFTYNKTIKWGKGKISTVKIKYLYRVTDQLDIIRNANI